MAAAKAALPAWSNTPPAKRAQVMFNFRDQLRANLDELATQISAQHGKTFDDAKGEVARGLEVVEFACGIPHLLKGEFSEDVGVGTDSYSVRQPLGVVAGITPFNFRRWCRCGCSRWRWPAATPSSSSRRSATPARR